MFIVRVVACLLLLLLATPARAQEKEPGDQGPQDAGAPLQLVGIDGHKLTAADTRPIDVHMGDDIALTFDRDPPSPVGLFLDDRLVPALPSRSSLVTPHTTIFSLERTTDNDAVWRRILGERHAVTLAAASPDGTRATAPIATRLCFRSSLGDIAASGILLFLYAVAAIQGIRKGMLCDAGPTSSLSLARCQMFVWTTLIVGAFLILWTVTGSADTITSQALVLMGISAATAMGANIVGDAKKNDAVNAVVAQATLAGSPPSVAEKAAITKSVDQTRYAAVGALRDLLCDANGPALHRVQVLTWTLILAVLFVVGVYRDLAMPQFSDTLLALMGVSGATYVGFKFPEAT